MVPVPHLPWRLIETNLEGGHERPLTDPQGTGPLQDLTRLSGAAGATHRRSRVLELCLSHEKLLLSVAAPELGIAGDPDALSLDQPRPAPVQPGKSPLSPERTESHSLFKSECHFMFIKKAKFHLHLISTTNKINLVSCGRKRVKIHTKSKETNLTIKLLIGHFNHEFQLLK